MQSTFDERNWLAWLVKVRILILTFLLGIQLAVSESTPTRLPLRLFLSTILLWYTVSLFYILLLSFWPENRVQASLQVLTDLIMVSLVVHETGGWDSSLNFLTLWSSSWLASCFRGFGRIWLRRWPSFFMAPFLNSITTEWCRPTAQPIRN